MKSYGCPSVGISVSGADHRNLLRGFFHIAHTNVPFGGYDFDLLFDLHLFAKIALFILILLISGINISGITFVQCCPNVFDVGPT